MIRFPAREITVGNRPLGGNNPIRLQSMTNTDTCNVAATVGQAIRIFEAGADYVRISVPTRESASRLSQIRKAVTEAGFDLPLIADIHFNPELALIAARHFEAVRINPGNFTGLPRRNQTLWSDSEYQADLDLLIQNLTPLLKACKEYGVAIRIGTNFGSLSKRVISRLGNTPESMAESTIEFLKAFESLGFYNTAISVKASSPLITVKSYVLMAERMLQENMAYPMHVGVTEAGEGEDGRIKSALGISTLLGMGIGDTIRVSLSEAPEDEIPVARRIAAPFQKAFTQPRQPRESFSVPQINFHSQNAPVLPHKLKAIILSEPETHTSDFEVLMQPPSKQNEQSDKKQIGNVICRQTAFKYPIWHWSKLMDNSGNYHPDWNFFAFEPGCDTRMMANLTQVAGPVIVVNMSAIGNDGIVQPFMEQAARYGVNPAIVLQKSFSETDEEDVLLKAVALAGPLLLQRKIQGLYLQAPHLPNPNFLTQSSFGLLQAAGLRITQNEYISCPTCSRTSFDLVSITRKVKEVLGRCNNTGLKIAIMGCVVNGPGEMADADFGILGASKGKVHLYKGSTPLIKNLTEDEAVAELLNLVLKEGVTKTFKKE